MPRYPDLSSALSGMRGSVFSKLAHRLERHEGEVYPFHVGDTWLEPPRGCRMQDLRELDHPGMHRYAPPRGLPRFIDAIVERTRARTEVATERADVLVSAGATGGIGAVFGAILEPGDEVLVLAPYWPLVDGIVRSCRGVPVSVPFSAVAGEDDVVDGPAAAVAALERHQTPRTAAVYVSTPNNPTGRIIPADQLEAIARWASDRGLWIVSDEVYDDYVYRGTHAPLRPMAPARTFSVHSVSKAFGMAGNRCGWVVGPKDAIAEIAKISTHTFYSTPTASQIAGSRALEGAGEPWVRDVRGRYEALGLEAASALGVESPEGSQFLFLDVADRIGDDGLAGLLERCVERGVLAAPGPSFGPYPTHLRICYTAAAPDIVRRGLAVLAELLGRGGTVAAD